MKALLLYLSSQMLPEGHLQSSVSLQVEAMYPRDTDIHYASSATKINATV